MGTVKQLENMAFHGHADNTTHPVSGESSAGAEFPAEWSTTEGGRVKIYQVRSPV